MKDRKQIKLKDRRKKKYHRPQAIIIGKDGMACDISRLKEKKYEEKEEI